MPLKFGTDGVRGLAGRELTPELVLALGRAAARVLGGHRFLVGRDTRVSGPMLQAALAAGLAAEGADVVDLGVLPTPGVAFLSSAHGVPAAMISASHNPFPDNGVKLFAAGGRKLDDEIEERLEAELDALWHRRGDEAGGDVPTGDLLGRLELGAEMAEPYVDHVIASIEGRRVDGARIVVDCANGAASGIAPRVFDAVGASVHVLHADPDGTNINDRCGSTHPEALRDAVLAHDADLGLAFDGDADRVLAIDHRGEVVDGDAMLAICARDLRDRGRLDHDTLVVTVMSNLGLKLAMAEAGISVVETKVGDRYVLEALESGGFALGGEQSGHIIFKHLASTGDGVLTGLQLLDVVHRSGSHLADLADAAMRRFPQVLRNVTVADRDALAGAASVWDEVAEVEAELGDTGRVLLRASGTEQLIRVMVEAPTADEAERATDRLAKRVAEALGPPRQA